MTHKSRGYNISWMYRVSVRTLKTKIMECKNVESKKKNLESYTDKIKYTIQEGVYSGETIKWMNRKTLLNTKTLHRLLLRWEEVSVCNKKKKKNPKIYILLNTTNWRGIDTDTWCTSYGRRETINVGQWRLILYIIIGRYILSQKLLLLAQSYNSINEILTYN